VEVVEEEERVFPDEEDLGRCVWAVGEEGGRGVAAMG
jgi:hypothetical protein